MADELIVLLGSKLVIEDQKEQKEQKEQKSREDKKIGYVYDSEMSRHRCRHEAHPESPRRILKIYQTLSDLLPEMIEVVSRKATREEIITTHNPSLYDRIHDANCDKDFDQLERQYNSFYMNEGTFDCALLAAGCVIEITEQVVTRKIKHGVAIVRPPGHHAEHDSCMGFCVFNNVAVAANVMREKYQMKRIVILDYDVHHGNATQHMFYDTNEVLYISLHRYDDARFYPGSRDAGPNKIGIDKGYGYNINVAWNIKHKKYGDSEYKYAFDHLIIPVLKQYQPELILVSAGFDCALGDPLGGLAVTEKGFSYMTHQLSSLAPTVIALEGGYNIDVISSCMKACVNTLLNHAEMKIEMEDNYLHNYEEPEKKAIQSVNETKKFLSSVWFKD